MALQHPTTVMRRMSLTRLRSLSSSTLVVGAVLGVSVLLTGCPSPVKCLAYSVDSPLVTVTYPDGQLVCDASVTATISTNNGIFHSQFQPTRSPPCMYLGGGIAGIYRITIQHRNVVKVVHVTVTSTDCGVHFVHVKVTIPE